MQLLIPYHRVELHMSTKHNGDLELTILDDIDLHQDLLYQLFNAMSCQDFINTIGTQQFEQLIKFYNSPDFEE